jgi:hypothetical protein
MKFNLALPINSNRVRFRITHFHTIANYLILAPGDSFEFRTIEEVKPDVWSWVPHKVTVIDAVTKMKDGVKYLNALVATYSELDKYGLLFTWENDNTNIRFEMNTNFYFNHIDHRFEFFFGSYNDSSDILATVPIGDKFVWTFKSTPLNGFGDILFILSNKANVIGVNKYVPPQIVGIPSDSEFKLSVAYKYADFIHPGCPCTSRKPGYWVHCRAEDLANVEFTLVDFMFERVLITNPILLSLEVEFINNPLESLA